MANYKRGDDGPLYIPAEFCGGNISIQEYELVYGDELTEDNCSSESIIKLGGIPTLDQTGNKRRNGHI